ncbi:MAG: hypothetical protein WCF90_05035 [Methanomicrobiales archaeon]
MAVINRLRTLVGTGQQRGLGGEGLLRTGGRKPEGLAVLSAAYDNGIRYFDSAPAYIENEHY